MMFKVAKLGIAFAAVLAWTVPAAYAGIPDVTNSFYVPQSGTPDPWVASGNAPSVEVEGTLATRFFRMCPNNDGGTSLPQNARIKITVRDVNNQPIPNIAAADIYILFNGGTPLQGFTGTGADSIIANTQYNPALPVQGGGTFACPNVNILTADRATNSAGQTYLTFGGSDPNTPGLFLRNSNRKWGHYDSDLKVMVLGFQLSGRLTSASANGTYALRIKNYDWHTSFGLNTTMNQGETVSLSDISPIVTGGATPPGTLWWKDFDSSGTVNSPDTAAVRGHAAHNCGQGCNSVTGLGCLNTSGGPTLDPHP